ncbi:MAG: sigma-54-dependent Fis family transcriptional regulator [Nitrospinae bacterium]|nr:sigma-54-dependent Fis family transcriptional regulator [Nitrospinota bacterium]
MRQVFDTMGRLLDNDSTVLILGESGAGKELVAQAIHANSLRRHKPLITVNCGAIPEELLESELFGHEKGSFTGAIRTRIGKFELAHGGTIFLDEIGDMSPTLQVKLLRILQERQFERVGGARTIKVDVRVMAATNQNLEKAIRERRFREDLYYRLNVVPIELPPLRQRGEDVSLLIGHFVKLFSRKMNRRISGISPEALARLKSYDWPGNVRELEHMIERLVVLKGEGVIETADLPLKLRDLAPEEEAQLFSDMLLVGEPEEMETLPVARPHAVAPTPTVTATAPTPSAPDRDRMTDDISAAAATMNSALSPPLPVAPAAFDPATFVVELPEEGLNLKEVVDRFETQLILSALERCGWVKNKAAQLLGLNRTTLVEKLKKKKLTTPDDLTPDGE